MLLQRAAASAALIILASAFAAAASAGDVAVGNRAELVRAVAAAEPGTRILIAPGIYEGGLHAENLRGEQGKPIVLAAADDSQPPQFRGENSGFHLAAPSFVELHNLVLIGARGNGLNIDDGGDRGRPARGIVLRGLTIRDIGPTGNRDGIKLSGVDNFRVEDCTIERWGDNGSAIDMVGCHDGVISGCTFRYRNDVAANGVQTKGGSRNIVIQRCRFEQSGSRAVNAGGSTGLAFFRPRVEGYEAKDITVEDCTFVECSAPACFVGVDGAVFRYNTIYRPKGYVVRILQESRGSQFAPSRNGVFRNNLIAYRSDELRGIVNIGPGTAPETFTFVNNHWFCIDRPEQSDRLGLPVKERGGVHGIDPLFIDPAAGDLRLRESSPVEDAGVRSR